MCVLSAYVWIILLTFVTVDIHNDMCWSHFTCTSAVKKIYFIKKLYFWEILLLALPVVYSRLKPPYTIAE